MSKTTINFDRNDSANYTHSGASQTITCPNGVMARLSTEAPSEIRDAILVANGNVVIFQKMEDNIADTMIPIGTSGNYLIFRFNYKNNYFIVHDYCYEDFYRHNGNTKSVDTFVKDDAAGTYVYDEEMASFVTKEPVETRQRYSCTTLSVPIQDKGERIEGSIETTDMVFADFTTTDSVIDMHINALVSVAGLRLTWSSDTNTQFMEMNDRIPLGSLEATGSFDNSIVRYAGSKYVVSKKLNPSSREAMAIKYKIIADYNNNGYDDIEILDINLLTSMRMYESTTSGEDSDA
jgi:hypothetical protein